MKKRADGRYQANITITDARGEKKRKTFYGSTPNEVRRAILAYTGEKAKGITMNEAYRAWYDDEWAGLRYNTQAGYKKPVEDILEEFGDQRINEITTLQIERFLADLGKKGFSKHTVEMRKIVLNRIYKHALRFGEASSNPAQYAKLPGGLSQKKREMPEDRTLEQINRLKPEGFNLLPILLYYTGMRRGEALALEWGDIDLSKRRIQVKKEIEFHGNKPVVVQMVKTDAGYRTIIIRLKLLEILKTQQGSGPLFPGKSGSYLTKGELIDWWERLKLDATPHQLRHAYVTELFEAKVPAEVAMTQTGHSDIRTMRQIYTHIRNNQKEKATALLDAYDTDDGA